MTEHPNTRRTRRLCDAAARGDLEAYGRALSDDVVLHVPGGSPLPGSYEGKDAIFGFIGTVGEMTDNTFRFEVFDILASDERDGARLDIGMVEVRSFDANGLVSESRVYPEEMTVLDDFFS